MINDISLSQFKAMDRAANVPSYVAALEAFDAIPELQELKVLGRERRAGCQGRCSASSSGLDLATLRSPPVSSSSRKVWPPSISLISAVTPKRPGP